MSESPRTARRIARWAFRIAAALIVLALALVAAIHTSPVRRYALARAIAYLEDEYHLQITASDLRYNLLALSVSLREVRVAADTAPSSPFFEAAFVALDLPQSAVLGPFAIDSIAIEAGRIRIVRERDGRTNLPAASAAEGGAPDALRLIALAATGFSVEDESSCASPA
jgi:hypothetical protein